MRPRQRCGASLSIVLVAFGAHAAGGAPHGGVDRPVYLDADTLHVTCDKAVIPAVAAATIDESSNGLRIDYRLPDNSNAIYVRAGAFTEADLPEVPWGVGCRLERPKRGVTITVFVTDSGGELWEYVLPPVPRWAPAGPVELEIPFSWFTIVPWERRDGVFDATTLETISFRLTNAEPQQRQQGEIEIVDLTLLDARRPVTALNQNGFSVVNLEGAFNSDGVAYRENSLDGDFHTGDWQHRALPAEQFPEAGVKALVGIPFIIPSVANGQNNHIRCNGQLLTGFSGGHYSALYVLATGKFGKQMGDITLHYADGTSNRVLLEVSDWTDGPSSGDVAAVLFSGTYHEDTIEERQPKLYIQSMRIDINKALERIELPHNDFLKVFALTLATSPSPPEVAALQRQSLAEVYPRYAMKTLDELDFTQAPRGAGVYGGYVSRRGGRHEVDESWTNGSLAFTLDVEHLRSRLPRMAMQWVGYLGHDRPLVLGQFAFPGATFTTIHSDIPDWTCIQYHAATASEDSTLNVSLSRAWPALRLDTSLASLCWQIGDGQGDAWLAVPTHSGIVTIESGASSIPELAEPWLMTWTRHAEVNAIVPMLLVLQHRPKHMRSLAIENFGVALDVQFTDMAGGVCAMPLFGIKPIPVSEAEAWASDGLPEMVVNQCRQWTRRLQRFPVTVDESYALDPDAAEITFATSWTFEAWKSEWDTEPDPIAIIPPVVTLAQAHDYPAHIANEIVDASYDTFWGSAALVAGDMTEVTLSLPRYVASAPIPARVTGAPLFDSITEELRDAVAHAVPSNLATHQYAATGDEARLRALAPAYLALGGMDDRVRAYTRGIAENLVDPNTLKVEKEPITGQYYFMDDRFWAMDENFDKEWQIGYILQGLWSYAYYNEDAAFLKDNWDTIRGLYAYYQIVFDWATASTFTMANGYNANSDGIRVAWEGMLCLARMAAMVGDTRTYEDAVARASKQMMSLYASWYAPRWALEHAYTMEQYRPVRPEEIELRFAPDNSWTEFFTCNLSHPSDFFQTTHAFYCFNLSHLAFLHDSGIGERFLRPWLEEIVPALHPNWCDGNVFSEASGQYYGGAHTMAHLVARALVLGEDTDALYECYRRSVDGTHVSTQWYKPESVAVETLTALLMGAAPMVYAPVLHAQVLENLFDVTGLHRIRLRGSENVDTSVYIRVGARRVHEICVDNTPRDPTQAEGIEDLRIPVALEEQQETLIEVRYL